MKKRALLIGINDYKLLGELQYARQDAEAVAEALCQYYGFTDQDITLMSCQTEGATHGLSRYIEHALMNLNDEKDLDLLVFGFWGHGFAPLPGRRYLCGLDTSEHDLERSAVSFDIVKARLAQIQAKNTLLLLDCCQNRPAGRSASAAPMTDGEEIALASLARDIQVAQRKQQTASMPTVAILNACCEGQKAYEWDSRQHGIFTAHLLDAFQQGFDSIAPLASWIVDRVAKTAKEVHCQTQVPFITIEGKGDITLSQGVATYTAAAKIEKPPIRSSVRPPKPPQPVQPEPAAQWWVLVDGQEKGPLDEPAIRDLIANRKVSSDSVCWTEGMSEWQTFNNTKRLSGLLPPKHASVDVNQIESDDTQEINKELQKTIVSDVEQCEKLTNAGKGSKGYIRDAYQTQLAVWQNAADLGWPEGQWLIGRCFDEGFGKSKDQSIAVEWYCKAAEQGYALAQRTLGLCYDNGTGVIKDQAEAVKWFRKAAEQGIEPAQTNLAICYRDGLGVGEDKKEAFKWLKIAAEQGYDRAQGLLAIWYRDGVGVGEDKKEAFKWLKRAVDQGNMAAQVWLGVEYQFGLGGLVAVDHIQAVEWYRKAAEQGDKDAKKYLEDLEKEIEKENKSLCFLTTAVCTALNKSDNCPELTSLRRLRDTYMQETPGHRAEVTEYYRIAPAIVERINAQPNRDELWHDLAGRFILPCASLVDKNNLGEAYRIYNKMIVDLKQKYCP